MTFILKLQTSLARAGIQLLVVAVATTVPGLVIAKDVPRLGRAVIASHHFSIDRFATTVAQLDDLQQATARRDAPKSGAPRCWSAPHATHGPLHHGHALMRSGDINRAREHFRACLEAGLPEAALALGGTYDASKLGKAQRRNADARQAERWYREWHRLSTEQGAISPGIDLHRLIKALARR